MELGLAGKTAIVCASSAGLGRAIATRLAREGCTVILNGRTRERLEEAAAAIRADTQATILTVCGDVQDADVQAALLDAAPRPDILINNAGGPPLRDFRDVDRDAFQQGLVENMIAPIEMIQRVVDGMIERRFGRIVNVTSDTSKAVYKGLELSSGARLGLTGFVAGVSRSVAHAGVTINCLLPGAFETDRLVSVYEGTARLTGKPYRQVVDEARASIPVGRFGRPDEFGAACAFLCSEHAGYITGQSILLDGGYLPNIL